MKYTTNLILLTASLWSYSNESAISSSPCSVSSIPISCTSAAGGAGAGGGIVAPSQQKILESTSMSSIMLTSCSTYAPSAVLPPQSMSTSITHCPSNQTAFCPYQLSSCSYSNVTMAFRLENTQADYFKASEFCRDRSNGTFPYSLNSTCTPQVIISCPDQIFFQCRKGFYAVDEMGGGARCVAMIELVPSDAWINGSPQMVYSDGTVKGFVIGGTRTWSPTECTDGPVPLPLENCSSEKCGEMAGRFVAGAASVTRTVPTSMITLASRVAAKPLRPTIPLTEGKTPIGTSPVELEFENS